MSATAVPPAPSALPALLTAEEFARRYAGRRVELVQGRVVELPMPFLNHGKICNWVAFYLTQYVLARDIGHVMTNDSWMLIDQEPDTVRGMDVCYFSYARLPKGKVPEGLLPVVPELVFEVRSPSDRWTNVVTKAMEYLTAGVNVVVILDPKTESATVFRPDDRQIVFESTDNLVIPDVLPEFSAPVRSFFE